MVLRAPKGNFHLWGPTLSLFEADLLPHSKSRLYKPLLSCASSALQRQLRIRRVNTTPYFLDVSGIDMNQFSDQHFSWKISQSWHLSWDVGRTC